MNTFKKIYFIGIILVTLFVIAIFMVNEKAHREELNKIRHLERVRNDEIDKLNTIRMRSTPCPVSRLEDPRTCYFQSNYRCSWNEDAKRCDLR